MNKKHPFLIPAVSILFLVSGIAVAAPAQVPPKNEWLDQENRWKEKFKGGETSPGGLEIRNKVCKNAQERVAARWQKYSDKKLAKLTNYDRGVQVLEKRIAFYESRKFTAEELATLKNDKIELERLIGLYRSAYTAFMTSLGEAKTIPCANYQGTFLPELQQAKDAWAEVKAASDAIKDYYKESVKPHMQELNAQIADKVNEMEEE